MSQTLDFTFTLTVTLPDAATVVATPKVTAVAVAPADTVDKEITVDVVVPIAVEKTEHPKIGPTEQVLLNALAEHHGRVADPSGRASTILIDKAGCESETAARQALVKLDERGLIERTINGKRTSRIVLTTDGWSLARATLALRPNGVE